jgi:DNA-binding NarL/FixJ family response regulator
VVNKAAPPDALVEAIRNVYRGRTVFPHVGPERLQASAGRLEAEDLAILGMRVDRTPLDQIAGTLGLGQGALDDRLRAMIMRLAPAVRDRVPG